jgi:hypothetical protein
MLATADAHGVYEKVGFVPLPNPERIMVLGAESPPELLFSATRRRGRNVGGCR